MTTDLPQTGNGISGPVNHSRSFAGKTVTLAHGSGGKATRDLIETLFLHHFDNPVLRELEDQARLPLQDIQRWGDRLAFTTDSFVVDPLFFPGSDIGTLAVNGTVNDLAMSGAKPLFLSCGFILEEGLPFDTLERIALSMKQAAHIASIQIVTGDTKVVQRGAADKIFINTAGIGIVPESINISARRATPGDKILVNGFLGDHGAAILQVRGDLSLESSIRSDCRPLHTLVQNMMKACPDIHCLRDATRGGVATVLNEFTRSAEVGILLKEREIPIRQEVRGLCEILGLDPLYLANEGLLVAIVPEANALSVLECMRSEPEGAQAAIVGEVVDGPKERVIMKTSFGGDRIVDMKVGEQLPRIC